MLFDVVRPDEADDEDAYSNENKGEDDDPWTDEEDMVKRRRSYTREHKLAAIAFALRADFKYRIIWLIRTGPYGREVPQRVAKKYIVCMGVTVLMS